MFLRTVDQTTRSSSLELTGVFPGLVAAYFPLPSSHSAPAAAPEQRWPCWSTMDSQLPCEVRWSSTRVYLAPSCHLSFDPCTTSSKRPCCHHLDSSPHPGPLTSITLSLRECIMGYVFLSISPGLGCMCCRTKNTLCVGAASGGTAWCSLKVCWGEWIWLIQRTPRESVPRPRAEHL